jgi:hypothetical protein
LAPLEPTGLFKESKTLETQDLESWMCLEKIADCVPRLVAHPKVIHRIQVNKAFIFFDGASDCKEILVTDIKGKVYGKARAQNFQTTVSTQPIRENKTIDRTTMKWQR